MGLVSLHGLAQRLARDRVVRAGGLRSPAARDFSRWATLTILLAIVVSGCGTARTAQSNNGAMSVVASFYPLQYFAERIGGARVNLYNPVPPGAEPHDLELTPRDIERI